VPCLGGFQGLAGESPEHVAVNSHLALPGEDSWTGDLPRALLPGVVLRS